MPAHKTAKYKDGYVWVEYCVDCGKEGAMLAEECGSKPIPKIHEMWCASYKPSFTCIREKCDCGVESEDSGLKNFTSGLPDKVDK